MKSTKTYENLRSIGLHNATFNIDWIIEFINTHLDQRVPVPFPTTPSEFPSSRIYGNFFSLFDVQKIAQTAQGLTIQGDPVHLTDVMKYVLDSAMNDHEPYFKTNNWNANFFEDYENKILRKKCIFYNLVYFQDTKKYSGVWRVKDSPYTGVDYGLPSNATVAQRNFLLYKHLVKKLCQEGVIEIFFKFTRFLEIDTSVMDPRELGRLITSTFVNSRDAMVEFHEHHETLQKIGAYLIENRKELSENLPENEYEQRRTFTFDIDTNSKHRRGKKTVTTKSKLSHKKSHNSSTSNSQIMFIVQDPNHFDTFYPMVIPGLVRSVEGNHYTLQLITGQIIQANVNQLKTVVDVYKKGIVDKVTQIEYREDGCPYLTSGWVLDTGDKLPDDQVKILVPGNDANTIRTLPALNVLPREWERYLFITLSKECRIPVLFRNVPAIIFYKESKNEQSGNLSHRTVLLFNGLIFKQPQNTMNDSFFNDVKTASGYKPGSSVHLIQVAPSGTNEEMRSAKCTIVSKTDDNERVNIETEDKFSWSVPYHYILPNWVDFGEIDRKKGFFYDPIQTNMCYEGEPGKIVSLESRHVQLKLLTQKKPFWVEITHTGLIPAHEFYHRGDQVFYARSYKLSSMDGEIIHVVNAEILTIHTELHTGSVSVQIRYLDEKKKEREANTVFDRIVPLNNTYAKSLQANYEKIKKR